MTRRVPRFYVMVRGVERGIHRSLRLSATRLIHIVVEKARRIWQAVESRPSSPVWSRIRQVAAHYGHDDVVRVLLNFEVDVDQRNRTQETPLHFACRKGHIEVVRALLECGADPT